MRDYRLALEEKLYAGAERIPKSEEYGVVYSILSDMIDENGPLLLADIARILNRPMNLDKSGFRTYSAFMVYVLRDRMRLYDNHKISIIPVSDAVQSVYGSYFRMISRKILNPHLQRIMHKSTESLIAYVKENFSAQRVTVVEWNPKSN